MAVDGRNDDIENYILRSMKKAQNDVLPSNDVVPIEYRKLQVTGGSTFIVSLPKPWIRDHGLERGTVVGVQPLPTGELRITPTEVKPVRRSAVVDLDHLPDQALYDFLIGLYVSGADAISVRKRKGMEPQVRRIIRSFLRDTRGMEVGEDSEDAMDIISLLNPRELSLQVSLNRMYLLVTSIVEDAATYLDDGVEEPLDDLEERERQIDARRLLIDRQVAMALESPNIERTLGVTRLQAVEHLAMARALERMGDHARSFANIVLNHRKRLNPALISEPRRHLDVWLGSLRTVIRNIYVKDVNHVIDAKRELEQSIAALEEFEEGIIEHGKGDKNNSVILFRFTEKIRRLCAYTIDLSETQINMVMGALIGIDASRPETL